MLNFELWQERSSFDLDATALSDLGKSYGLLEGATAFFDDVVENADELSNDFVVRATQLVATSQCVLRTTLRRFGIPFGVDQPQRETFELLRAFINESDARAVFDGLRKDDVAALDEQEGFAETLEETREQLRERLEIIKRRKTAWATLAYNVETLGDPSADLPSVWSRIVRATTNLCDELGEPPSSVRLRELLRNAISEIPDEVEKTAAFCRVAQQIDVFLENERAQTESESRLEDAEDFVSSELQTARERYSGGKIVFVGGIPQEHLRKRLEKAFQAEVLWASFDHGDSLDRFGSFLRDPDVGLFVVYIPWCSHKHSEELTAEIRAVGKDYIRQRKGTNPEMIARTICQQLSLSNGRDPS